MNIQIFGTKKCNDTKKAQRFFKERGVKFQFIDLVEKDISRGEFNSIKNSLGGLDALIDKDSKDKDTLALIEYLTPDQREDKIYEYQHIIKTPIVRNGKLATIGNNPEVWKTWF